jgi:hypothetical protein
MGKPGPGAGEAFVGHPGLRPVPAPAGAVAGRPAAGYTKPWSSMALTTLRKPAIFAPAR